MLVLYLTGISRELAKIITEQSESLRSGREASLQAMHQIKRDAYVMKDALLHNDLRAFSETLGRSWEAKKRTASGITNAEINRICDLALSAGALSGKVSGAGGGGFLFFMVPRNVGRACCGTGARAWRHRAVQLYEDRRSGVAGLIRIAVCERRASVRSAPVARRSRACAMPCMMASASSIACR